MYDVKSLNTFFKLPLNTVYLLSLCNFSEEHNFLSLLSYHLQMKKIITTLVLLISIHAAGAATLYKAPGINFNIIENENEFILILNDTIQHPAAVEFQDSYSFLSKSKQITIDLNSGGGSNEEGYKIISFIDRLKSEGFNVKTRVQNGRMCGSMCVPIFLAADVREAAETSAFMFHGTTVGFGTVPVKASTDELYRYMKSRGLTEEFEKYLWDKKALLLPGEYWLSGKELVDLNSGIITNLLGRHIIRKAVKMPYTPKL